MIRESQPQQYELISPEERVRRDPRGMVGVTALSKNTVLYPVSPESDIEIQAGEGEANG